MVLPETVMSAGVNFVPVVRGVEEQDADDADEIEKVLTAVALVAAVVVVVVVDGEGEDACAGVGIDDLAL